jgi:glutathione S-transferase
MEPLDDEGVTMSYLAVHYFQTCRVRHWINQEIFLSPKFLMLKVYSTVANIGIDFVPAPYPTAESLSNIPLPAAFLDGKAVGCEGILKYLKSIYDIDVAVPSSSHEDRLALSAWAQGVLQEAIEYTLFGHYECYNKFTLPVMFDSMPRPYADRYCSGMMDAWINRDRELIDSKVRELFRYLNSKIRSSKFFFSNENPSLCDIVLYSHLSVLLSIPDKFCPFFYVGDNTDEYTSEQLNRLKSYLLDFDDWLWHLNSKRSEQIQGNTLTPSSLVAARGSCVPIQNNNEQEETSGILKVEKPLLGEGRDQKQNIAFLVAVGAVMLSVVALNRYQ